MVEAGIEAKRRLLPSTVLNILLIILDCNVDEMCADVSDFYRSLCKTAVCWLL